MIAMIGLAVGLHFMGLTLPPIGSPVADLKEKDGYYEQVSDAILPPSGRRFAKAMHSKQLGRVTIYVRTVHGTVDALSVVCYRAKKCGAVNDLKRACRQLAEKSWTCIDEATKMTFHLSVCSGRIYWISKNGQDDPIGVCAD